MTRPELVLKLAEANPHLTPRDTEIVATIFNEITAALSRNDRVEQRGFGVFSVRHRGPRVSCNPRSGVRVDVPEKLAPVFKTGALMRVRLNS